MLTTNNLQQYKQAFKKILLHLLKRDAKIVPENTKTIDNQNISKIIESKTIALHKKLKHCFSILALDENSFLYKLLKNTYASTMPYNLYSTHIDGSKYVFYTIPTKDIKSNNVFAIYRTIIDDNNLIPLFNVYIQRYKKYLHHNHNDSRSEHFFYLCLTIGMLGYPLIWFITAALSDID